MKNMTVFTQYTIGQDAYESFPQYFSLYGNKILIIGGETAMSKGLPKLKAALSGTQGEILDALVYGKECTYEAMDRFAQIATVTGAQMIVGMGGGKALDTAKGAAQRCGLPVFTFPTIASTCAAASSLSIVYKEDHSFDSFYFLDRPAITTFIDGEIIARAPARYLRAGMGDTIAKSYECAFSARDLILDHGNTLGILISQECAPPILRYGVQGLKDCENDRFTFSLEQVILAIIVTTGMVSTLIEMKYNGALAHALFYGNTLLPGFESNNIHGDSVGYGVLVQLVLDDRRQEALELKNFYLKIGIPTTLKEQGLPLDYAFLSPALEAAVDDPDMEVTPYPVTSKMIFDAIAATETL